MLLVTANLDQYDVQCPDDAVVRINLAWMPSLGDLQSLLNRLEQDVFLDHPVGRSKPPANFYTLDELKPIIRTHGNVRYVAVSNVEQPSQLDPYKEAFGDDISVVPKIETIAGTDNIGAIVQALQDQEEQVIMIDHDDLLQDLAKHGVDISTLYTEYIEPIEVFCKAADVTVLRTKGVIFSD